MTDVLITICGNQLAKNWSRKTPLPKKVWIMSLNSKFFKSCFQNKILKFDMTLSTISLTTHCNMSAAHIYMLLLDMQIIQPSQLQPQTLSVTTPFRALIIDMKLHSNLSQKECHIWKKHVNTKRILLRRVFSPLKQAKPALKFGNFPENCWSKKVSCKEVKRFISKAWSLQTDCHCTVTTAF